MKSNDGKKKVSEKVEVKEVYVLTSGVELLDEPEGKPISELAEAEKLVVIDRSKEMKEWRTRRNYWYKIRSRDGKEGWVWGDDVGREVKPTGKVEEKLETPELEKLTINELIDQGNKLLQANQPLEALKCFEKATSVAPNDSLGFFLLGFTYQELGQDQKSIVPYKRAIEISPKDFWAYNNLGLAYIRTRQFELAVEVLEKAITLKPPKDMYNDDVEAKAIVVRNLISAYRALGNTEEIKKLQEKYDFRG